MLFGAVPGVVLGVVSIVMSRFQFNRSFLRLCNYDHIQPAQQWEFEISNPKTAIYHPTTNSCLAGIQKPTHVFKSLCSPKNGYRIPCQK